MGIKFNSHTKTYEVSYSKRHPITRQPKNLRRKGIKSKAEANRVYAELIIQVDKKLNESVIPSWESLVKDYIRSLSERDVSKKTVDSYWLSLRAHTFKDWGSLLVDSITALAIRTLIKEKVGHRSASHQKNVLKYIRGAFEFGVERGDLASNPTPRMKFKIGNKLKDVLTEEQARILLTQAKVQESEWYPIWATALYTGMRSGELYALTWDKVDLGSRMIKVDCSWNNKDGFKDTKSGDDRLVEIAADLLVVFKQLYLRRADSHFVLPRIDKWDRGEQARELRLFLMGLGLPRIRFHDLRASWATIMLTKGISAPRVMKMGGWKDLKTMQYYIRKAGIDLKGITDNFTLHDPLLYTCNLLEIV